jgi:hypothetical protein
MSLISWAENEKRRGRALRWILRIGCLAIGLYVAVILFTMIFGFVRT